MLEIIVEFLMAHLPPGMRLVSAKEHSVKFVYGTSDIYVSAKGGNIDVWNTATIPDECFTSEFDLGDPQLFDKLQSLFQVKIPELIKL